MWHLFQLVKVHLYLFYLVNISVYLSQGDLQAIFHVKVSDLRFFVRGRNLNGKDDFFSYHYHFIIFFISVDAHIRRHKEGNRIPKRTFPKRTDLQG